MAEIGRHPVQLGAGEAEHFGAAINAGAVAGFGPKQLDHAAGAGADIDQPVDCMTAQCRAHGVFHDRFGNVEGPDSVPVLRVLCEPMLGGAGAVRPDGRQLGRIGNRPVVAARLRGPGIQRGKQRRRACGIAHGEEHPAAFLAAGRDPGIAQDFHMA